MRKATKSRILALAVLTVTIWVGARACGNNPIDTEDEYRYVPPTPVVNADPYQMRAIKCSDYGNDVEPCWTMEKGKFSLILSWYPKKAIPLHECTEEDGGAKLPCIWKDNNTTKKKSDPITRNIFFKKATFS